MKRLYLCIPDWNTECRKTNCMVLNGGECTLTTHKEFSTLEVTKIVERALESPEVKKPIFTDNEGNYE